MRAESAVMFQKVHNYLHELIPERPSILREMERYATDQDFPIVGPLVGRFLYQVVIMTKARRILELGSGFGYSAFWFSLAAGSKGHIVMTDRDKKNKTRAFDYFKRAGLQSQFVFKVGDALRLARGFEGPFDIILNDIDKDEYPAALDIAAARLRKGGLFITDNVLWSGRVCEKRPDKTTRAIVDFTRNLYSDGRFYTTVMPIRDGVSLSVRL
jgi:caffeoyl-CoA O-methyltransferase